MIYYCFLSNYMKNKKPTLFEHFEAIKDHRKRTPHHSLENILFITFCAVISGCDGFVSIEEFAKIRKDWFEQFLDLPYGIPSHDTLGRVFACIDPEQFKKCFANWVSALVKHVTGDVISIDGKCLRGSHDEENDKSAIHLVSAWSSANGCVLGQEKVDEKSNEITALPELLKRLDIQGAVVTADAMHTQTKTAALIVEKKADFVLVLKGNQGTLNDDVRLFFEAPPANTEFHYHEMVEKEHGRIEEREIWLCTDVEWLNKMHPFPYLSSIVKVTSRRTIKDKVQEESRYFISSLKNPTPEKMAQIIRSHWHIENKLHWVLDMAFDEDRCRIRMGNADENIAIIRHIALNLLKQETTVKVGIKTKRQMAGWNTEYLLKVLKHF